MPQLVEQDVQLELGAEVAESAVAEGLERPVGDEGAEQLDVGDEGAQVGVLVGHSHPGRFIVQPEDALFDADVVLGLPALGEVAVEGVLLGLGRVDRVI